MARTCPNCGSAVPVDRVGNWPDLVTLLSLCRDALDKGHDDLARAVQHLVVEHKGNLGLRSRNLGRQLRAQMAEREQAPRQQ